MRKLLTEADGRRLAVKLLRDLHKQHCRVNERICDALGEDEEAPDMTDVLLNEEPNVLRRYLATVRANGNAKVERGFLCLLSEFMASAIDGTVMDLECYEEKYLEVRAPVPMTVAADRAKHDAGFQQFLAQSTKRRKPPGGKKSPTFTVQWPDE